MVRILADPVQLYSFAIPVKKRTAALRFINHLLVAEFIAALSNHGLLGNQNTVELIVHRLNIPERL